MKVMKQIVTVEKKCVNNFGLTQIEFSYRSLVVN